MPRDIPVGNGKLLVTFDDKYQVRDLYFPHVGQENHAGSGPCRFGVYADVPGTEKGRLVWTTDGWNISQKYLRDTLTTSVTLEHESMAVSLYCNDVVDFHRNILVRRIRVKNLASTSRTIRVIHHHDFNMYGSNIGDTAYFDPDLQGIVHYRQQRYLQSTWWADGKQHIDEFATGTSGFGGAEGTWRDAEDGVLQGNAIAQGAVDSTIAKHVRLEGGEEKVIYLVMTAAESREELLELNKWLAKTTPQGVIDRTTSYWRLWVGGTNISFGNLPPRVVEMFKRSLLVVRTQVDNNGAIVAANDSDIMQFARDTYSYVWPRDGALVADSLDLAGFPDIAKQFFLFSKNALSKEGFFYHKYNPDGSPASSWHPWVMRGQRSMPIQEDETALVVWAMWRHYFRYRDIEFIRPLWVDLVQPAADFMCEFRDKVTGLPLPSYDLWEERWGIHAFTVATVYAGLRAARNFAVCFGDREKAAKYDQAANEIKAAAARHLFSDKLGRFVRRLVPRETVAPEAKETHELFEVDEVLDASLYSIFKFHLFEVDDPRVVATMREVEQKLWVKTRVGGVARYENDYYHRVSNDIESVPGNPWFICTLWLADYYITRANTTAELKEALPIFEWAAAHSLESGVLAEQVHPYTNAPLSVSPLTWSHATVVSTAIKYLEKLESLQTCSGCHQPVFRLRRRGQVEVRSHASFSRVDAAFLTGDGNSTMSPTGDFAGFDPKTKKAATVRLAVDIRDCIGCEVCINECAQGVLRPVEGKAMVDARRIDQCDQDGQCVSVCPTNVISLTVLQPGHAAAGVDAVQEPSPHNHDKLVSGAPTAQSPHWRNPGRG